jgi:DNA topoisomerase IB
MGRLKRVDCSEPGIERRRQGRGFRYIDHEGRPLKDKPTLDRIRGLAIPPAWKDVWICRHENGHLQATGVDAAGRKQYLYHERWRTRRDQEKFDEMLEFAQSLPSMRKRVAADLRKRGMGRERVLACAVRLLDCGFFRIGSESYAEENESFGLATMRKKHVHVNGKEIVFDYPAKSGLRRVQQIVDPSVKVIVTTLKQRRGGKEELLAYKDGRRWMDIGSADINEHLKHVTGGDFSAKDFRTWNATLLAAVALATAAERNGSRAARQRAIKDAVKGVAFFLGNTPAVSRSSYIDPRVFDRYLSGWTIAPAVERVSPGEIGHPSTRGPIEKAVLDLISERNSSAIEKS